MVSALHSGSKGLGSISRARFYEGSERTCFHTGKFLVQFLKLFYSPILNMFSSHKIKKTFQAY